MLAVVRLRDLIDGIANMNLNRKSRSRSYSVLMTVFFGMVAILVFGAFAHAGEDTATSRLPISSGSEIEYPPFCIVDADGRANGFSVELLHAALAAVGRDVTFRIGTWAQVLGWLEQGEIQALPLVGRTPERESILDFTFPYMSLNGSIVVRKGTTDIRDLDALKGRRVAVMKGDNAEEFLRREDRGIEIHTTATFEKALRELSKGRHDAVVIQRLLALRLIQETGLTNLRIVNQPIEGFRQDFCFAAQEGDRETLALLNEGLALVIADGTFRHLHAKWFASLELPSHRRIVIGGDHNCPPFEYLDEDGRPTGFNVDITRATAREMDLDIEIRLGPWAEIRQELARGEIDAVQGMFYSTRRDLTFDFTPPTYGDPLRQCHSKGEGAPPDTVDELKGKRIVVQQSDIMHDFVVENGLKDQVSIVDTQEDALRELSEGKHDVALVARLTALYWIKQHGWDDLTVGRRPLLSSEFGFAVPQNHKALLAELGEGLKKLEKTGEYRQIYDKWLGIHEDYRPDLFSFLRYAAIVLIPLILLLLAFFLWSWSLRKQVARRTEELRESEEQYRLLANNTLDVTWTMNLDLEFTYVNPACFNLTGYTPEEWIGSRLSEHCDEENFAKMAQAIADETARGQEGSGVIFEATVLNRNLEPVPVEIHGKVIYGDNGLAVGLQGTTRDISERRQAEQKLRRSEALLKDAQRIGKIGGWEWDVDSRQLFWTEETYGIHDFDPNTTRPDGWEHIARSLECYEEEDRPRIRSAFERCVDEGEPYELECRFITTKGRRLWIRTAGQAVLEGDRVVKVIGNIQDITANKKIEEQLRNQNRFIQTILDNLPIGLAVNHFDEGTATYTNKRFEEIYGWPAEELKDTETFYEKVYPDPAYRKKIQAQVLADIESGDLERMHWENIEVTGKDGSKRIVSASNIPLFEQNIMISTVQDVTERKRAEEERVRLESQLRQAHKMEAIGTLAGGIAHDFNNILAAIVGYTELVLDDIPEGLPVKDNLEQILQSGLRAKKLVQQILSFSRRSDQERRPIRIGSVIEETMRLLRASLPTTIEIVQEVEAARGFVSADPTQIHQLLMNLCTNAAHAMRERGGVLKIQLKRVDLDENSAAGYAELSPGAYNDLSVTDTGEGMDRDTLERIFEPFFTTKETGQGTGMGLAVVHGIVKAHGGAITVYSEPGHGSTFHVYLPLMQTDEKEEAPIEKEPLPTGREHILLVDDEKALADIGRQMLERLGYQVTPRTSSLEALEVFKAQPNGFDLVITDQTMPNLTGVDLTKEMLSIRSDIPIIICTGFNAQISTQRVEEIGVKRLLMKPLVVREVATAIREVLDNEL